MEKQDMLLLELKDILKQFKCEYHDRTLRFMSTDASFRTFCNTCKAHEEEHCGILLKIDEFIEQV